MPKFNGDNNRFEFVASTTNIILIYQLISSISTFGDDCFLNINKGSLCFSISANNTCKIMLTLDRRLFSYYEFHPTKGTSGSDFTGNNNSTSKNASENPQSSSESETEIDESEPAEESEDAQNITINIDLRSFLETINIHIPNEKDQMDTKTKCTLGYQSEGSPFILTFEDDLIVERCELMTYFIDPETRATIRPKNRHKRTDKHRSRRSGNKNNQDNSSNSADDDDDILDNYDQMIDDNTIFQLDADQVIFESVMKSAIFYDALKDMKDLNTDEFVLYCSTKEVSNSGLGLAGNDILVPASKKLMFISKSNDTSIGYSKLIIPDKKPFLKDLEVFKPSSDDKERIESAEFIMIPCSASVSSFYHFEYFAKIIKAIKLSKLIKISKDMNGITSFLILVGSGALTRNTNCTNKDESYVHSEGRNVVTNNAQLFYGTSIEFITLESVPLEDWILSEELDADTLNAETSNDEMKYGYNNLAIEKMIQNEETIKTIEVTGDGQLMTMDDFFQSQTVNTSVNNSSAPINRQAQLRVTEELTRSVLGLGNGVNSSTEMNRKRTIDEVDHTKNIVDGLDSNKKDDSEFGKDLESANESDPNKKKDGSGKGRRKRKKDKHKRLETVGGAIEIPLFI